MAEPYAPRRRPWRERRRRRRLARTLKRARIPLRHWRRACARLDTLAHLDRRQRSHLRRLASEFLAEKAVVGAGGQPIDDTVRTVIAAQACLPVLALGLAVYRGWQTVVVYPDTFLVARADVDDAGVLHEGSEALAGEAWDQGPVILSWGDIAADGPDAPVDGAVIVHEFAHKLDMLSGGPNGRPPLHPDMDPAAWTHAFSDAYEQLCAAIDAGRDPVIDPYAAESPGEFFAVLSETFFAAPAALRATYPAVYRQLARFYRQDPAAVARR